MKSVRKTVVFLTAAAMCIGFSSFKPEISTNAELIAEAAISGNISGYCGTDLRWTLDYSGTLTISGTGDMYDHDYSYFVPWNDYSSDITTVEICDGVTSVGKNAFYDCSALTSITIMNPSCNIYDSRYTIDSNATIYGCPDSTAEKYADKYDRTFVSLNITTTTVTTTITASTTSRTTATTDSISTTSRTTTTTTEPTTTITRATTTTTKPITTTTIRTTTTTTEPTATTTTSNEPIIIAPVDESKLYIGSRIQLLYFAVNEVRWFTDNADTATVDQNGLVTVTGSGEVYIAAIDSQGNTAGITLIIPEPVSYGDVNLDGTVSLLDVIYINKYNAGAVSFDESQIERADCCADGMINASDTTALLKYVVESIESLPIETE